jgi:hypothetical protein
MFRQKSRKVLLPYVCLQLQRNGIGEKGHSKEYLDFRPLLSPDFLIYAAVCG